MSRALLYVALSRLERLDQLRIYGVTEEELASFPLRSNPRTEAHAAEFVERAGLQAHLPVEGVVTLPGLGHDMADNAIDQAWRRHRSRMSDGLALSRTPPFDWAQNFQVVNPPSSGDCGCRVGSVSPARFGVDDAGETT
jgi:hypothetical protein